MVGRAVVAGIACTLAACSPFGGGSYACTSDGECGANGACKQGFCAFADPACSATGYRYGDYSGPNAGQCVGGGGSGGDGGVDGNGGDFCYGKGIVHVCFATMPSGMRSFASNTAINTDDAGACAALTNSSELCAIAAQTIDVASGITLAAHGGKPLVLVATQGITIAGTLDASSHRAGVTGPGADLPGCDAGTAPNAAGGGGAGGTFGLRGGNGGNRFDASAGGGAGNVIVPAALRGGCKGQDGGGTNPGAGGSGGGGVYLIATNAIMITGTIDASGAGGNAGTAGSSGGGGGGAGGYIGLEAPTVMNSGNIFANGGGGGEASGSTTGGANGMDPSSPATPAPGGSLGSTNGGDGGNGAAAISSGQNGGNGNAAGAAGGGGGGGGGGGIVHVVPNTPLGGMVSPPQS